MPKPRREQVSLDATPYYHCVSRCVRRAFLCGMDRVTGYSYEHRRGWVEDILLYQAQVFTIDIAAYAVMSNHYHVILHVNQQRSKRLSDREVVERWHGLYKGTPLSQRFIRQAEPLSKQEQTMMKSLIKKWRARLCDISWFMRRINELIARQANQEDECTGHFWEGRFSSQALLDEKALVACLAYVDLNPVRAKIAATPEESQYTSIYRRLGQSRGCSNLKVGRQPDELIPFSAVQESNTRTYLPFDLKEYLMLLDWTGRGLVDRKGVIKDTQPPILERLGFKVAQWITLTKSFESSFCAEVGSPECLARSLVHFNRTRRHQVNQSRALLA